MAEALTPVVSTAIDYHSYPTRDVPHTEFPYPIADIPVEPDRPYRVDSETTLLDENDTLGKLQKRRTRGLTVPSRPMERPTLANRRYETERLKPVSKIPSLPQDKQPSEAGIAHGAPIDASDSDSSSSSDGEAPFGHPLHAARSPQEHKDLGARQLNRTRLRPIHGRKRGRLTVGDEDFRARNRIARDGRLNIKVNEAVNSGYLAKALGATIQSHLHPHLRKAELGVEELKAPQDQPQTVGKPPRMNIVIMVIGSRGDIQPFLKIGKVLQDKYGHRVRIATHPAFRKFVQEDIGLEFFSIGGDPSELMSFMVKNPGLIPSFDTLTSGEVGRRREQMYEMFQCFWRACINMTDDEKDTANLKTLKNRFPFVADAIIANPPSFAHIHCAEKLGIPLHLVFTFPYSPTVAFPHPLANIKSSNVDREYTNYMSYPLVDLMTWQGLGDLINRFRVKTLGLDPVSTLWAPGQLTRLRVPMTYLWSPGLVPKPADWGPEIDIAGYVFLDLASSFKPPPELEQFLTRSDEDPRPIIYIGFGSISGLDDPKAFCQLIFEATVKAGVKAVVSRGWGGMGDGMDIPNGVYMIDNVPHDWLFPRIDAVVHHGGAGTTAAGLKFGKPTMIVPFFGDQPFWAAMIVRAGAGARQVWPLKKLSIERFAQGIKECLEPEAKENARAIAKSIEVEGDGAQNAVDSFHRSLPMTGKHSMRCGTCDDRVAVWKVKQTGQRLSALAAEILVENKQITWADLDLLRHKDWTDFQGPGEPITGAGGVLVGAFQELLHGLGSIPETTKKDLKRIDKRKRKKQKRTVADAIVMPALVAHHARTISAEPTAEERRQAMTAVNLTGDAEPRKLTIAGVIGDTAESSQPGITRVDTQGTESRPTPIVLMRDVGKGVGHSFKAVALLPLDMLNAITLGFRNAPRLYGDRTVRPPPRAVTGLRQGLKVAGQELWHGVSDGVTGVVRIPYMEVQINGISRLPRGFAKGLGGLVLKPTAGGLAVANYTAKGLYVTVRKRFRDTKKTERWIRRAREQQGQGEMRELRLKEIAELQMDSNLQAKTAGSDGPVETRTKVLEKWTSERSEAMRTQHTKQKTEQDQRLNRQSLNRAQTT